MSLLIVSVERKNGKESKTLTSRGVAYLLDCSPDDAIALARKGEIKAEKDGRRWRYRQSDVLRYRRKLIAAGKGG